MATTPTTGTVSNGTVATSGTKTYVVGSASGIDTAALVEAAYVQKTARATTLDSVVTKNTAKVTAYTTLQSLSTTLQKSMDKLNASYGFGVTDNSIYSNKKAYVAAADGTNPDNILAVTIDSTAEKGSYNVEVIQLAKAMKVTSAAAADKTTAMGIDGTFSLGVDGGTQANITVTAGMSLSDMATAINSANTGIKASVVKTGDNAYTLVLAANETGSEITYAATGGTDVFNALGITAADNSFAHVTQPAQLAIIKIDGLEVTGKDNEFKDAIDGVSISLLGAKPGTEITVEVDLDYASTKDAILNFLNAYNAIRDFTITNQTASSDGAVSPDAALFSDPILKSLGQELSGAVTGMFNSGTALSTLADMGITFDSSNRLVLSDETKLNDALLNNYAGIQGLFQTSVSSDSTQLQLIRNTSAVGALNFQLNVQMDGSGAITSVTADGDANAFTVSGTRLIGVAGTKYEGMTFAYAGTTSSTINVNLNQGLADQIYNITDKYTNATTGSLQDVITRTQSSNDRLETEAARIRERAETYRDKLISRYADMESKINSANLLLKQIKAILGNTNKDDD